MTYGEDQAGEVLRKALVMEASNPANRGHAWQQCYGYFSSTDASDPDMDCLNLVAYLGCFGMYVRGSWMLQQSMVIHKEPLIIMRNSQYGPLRDMTRFDDETGMLFDILYDEIEMSYLRVRNEYDTKNLMSPILMTKIIHGVFGCIPAFDTFVVAGLKLSNISTSLLKTRRQETFKEL